MLFHVILPFNFALIIRLLPVKSSAQSIITSISAILNTAHISNFVNQNPSNSGVQVATTVATCHQNHI
jgi:hypothetical protein